MFSHHASKLCNIAGLATCVCMLVPSLHERPVDPVAVRCSPVPTASELDVLLDASELSPCDVLVFFDVPDATFVDVVVACEEPPPDELDELEPELDRDPDQHEPKWSQLELDVSLLPYDVDVAEVLPCDEPSVRDVPSLVPCVTTVPLRSDVAVPSCVVDERVVPRATADVAVSAPCVDMPYESMPMPTKWSMSTTMTAGGSCRA